VVRHDKYVCKRRVGVGSGFSELSTRIAVDLRACVPRTLSLSLSQTGGLLLRLPHRSPWHGSNGCQGGRTERVTCPRRVSLWRQVRNGPPPPPHKGFLPFTFFCVDWVDGSLLSRHMLLYSPRWPTPSARPLPARPLPRTPPQSSHCLWSSRSCTACVTVSISSYPSPHCIQIKRTVSTLCHISSLSMSRDCVLRLNLC